MAATQGGRGMLCLRWPGLREFGEADWRAVIATIDAHQSVARGVRYSAFVLEKPG
ncbi:hypothetical protein ACQEVS_04860 [Streptomyces sp. CA-181903]|uniref:hypothetical protein n=1 Tax=Streptomyces sp. CA-181903 TaxID=3240055 RepID=UPI003D8B40EE